MGTSRWIPYKNQVYRREIEARWAVFFDCLDIAYDSSPRCINFSPREVYCPDFWLPEFNMYFRAMQFSEMDTSSARKEARMASDIDCASVISFGGPWFMELHAFCQAGEYHEKCNSRVYFGRHPDTKKPCLISTEISEASKFYGGFSEERKEIPLFTSADGEISDFVSKGVMWAACFARDIHFLHGETYLLPGLELY